MITDAQVTAEVDRIIVALHTKARSGDILDHGPDGQAGAYAESDLFESPNTFSVVLWEDGEPRAYTDAVAARIDAMRVDVLDAGRMWAAISSGLVCVCEAAIGDDCAFSPERGWVEHQLCGKPFRGWSAAALVDATKDSA